MTQLEHEMTILRRLFEPWNTSPSGTVIWEPEVSDPSVEFKRGFISRAAQVIRAGDNALADTSFTVPNIGESDFAAIQEALVGDPEERDFVELAAACGRVCRTLTQFATC